MSEREKINSFLGSKKLAIAGVSRNKKKFGYSVFNTLTEKGFEVYPVNPNAVEIDGVKCFKSIAELPDDIKFLHVVTPKEQTASVIRQAHEKGINNIWIQQSSDTPAAIEFAGNNKMNLIHGRCILMYAEPVKGVHNFHRFLSKLFGSYPN